MTRKTDVVIIGAGVVGSAIARELSRYELDVTLIDRNEDVGGYASKCNSATLCSGHDAEPGSLEAKLTSASNRAYDQICKELDVEMKRIGMIYVAQDQEELVRLRAIKKKAILNGEYNLASCRPLPKHARLEKRNAYSGRALICLYGKERRQSRTKPIGTQWQRPESTA